MARSSLIGNLAVVLGLDTSAFERGATHAQRLMARTQRQLQQLGQKMTSIGQTLSVGITLPVVAFGTHAARTAIEAEELQTAFNDTFGDMADAMNRWAVATGDAMGRSTQEIQRGGFALGGLFIQAARTREEAARLSQQFTVLAQDLSSRFNVTSAEALQRLVSGLSGEAEPLRRFQVFLSETAVAARAAEMGLEKVNGRYTEQQKILARASLIMEATELAQGDVARTSHQTANQIRRAQAAWEELSVAIGTKLLPALTPMVEVLGRLLDRFSKLSPGVQTFVIGAAAIGAALGPVLMVAGSAVRIFAALLPWIARLGPALSAAGVAGAAAAGASGIGALLRVLGPLGIAATAVYIAFQKWPEISGFIQRVNERLSDSSAAARTAEAEARQAGRAWADFSSGPAFQASFGRALEEFFVSIGRLAQDFDRDAARLRQWANDFDAAAVRMWGNFEQWAQRAMATARQAVVNFVTSVGEWMGSRFRAAMDAARQTLENVGGWFARLYDRVVGNSYVPDMVREIGEHMRRLDQAMVDPARAATAQTADAFRSLQGEAAGLLARLFPAEARHNQYLREIQLLEEYATRSRMPVEQLAVALQQLRGEYLGETTPHGVLDAATELQEIPVDLAEIQRAVGGTTNWAMILQQAFMNVGGSAGSVLGGISALLQQSLVPSLGRATTAAYGLANAFQQIGQLLGEGIGALLDLFLPKKLAYGIGNVLGAIGGAFLQTKFGGFRASGGPVTGGRGYIVGERGPEFFMPTSSGWVMPSDQLGAAGGGGVARIEIVPSKYFDVHVAEGAAAIVSIAKPGIVSEAVGATGRALARRAL